MFVRLIFVVVSLRWKFFHAELFPNYGMCVVCVCTCVCMGVSVHGCICAYMCVNMLASHCKGLRDKSWQLNLKLNMYVCKHDVHTELYIHVIAVQTVFTFVLFHRHVTIEGCWLILMYFHQTSVKDWTTGYSTLPAFQVHCKHGFPIE